MPFVVGLDSMPPRLRIMWLAVFSLCCCTMIALWISSYWWHHAFHGRLTHGRAFNITSFGGRLTWWDFELESYIDYPLAAEVYPAAELANYQFPPARSGLGHVLDFHFYQTRFRLLAVPHWFIALLTSLLAAVPLCNTANWRFSLRGMFFVLSFVATLLGVAATVLR